VIHLYTLTIFGKEFLSLGELGTPTRRIRVGLKQAIEHSLAVVHVANLEERKPLLMKKKDVTREQPQSKIVLSHRCHRTGTTTNQQNP
jgi:hypothetical protein